MGFIVLMFAHQGAGGVVVTPKNELRFEAFVLSNVGAGAIQLTNIGRDESCI